MQHPVRPQVMTAIVIMMSMAGAAPVDRMARVEARTPGASPDQSRERSPGLSPAQPPGQAPGQPSGQVAAQTSVKKPWVVAHRGASAYAPENTLPAFQLAVEQGATFVEYDLQPTKDGVLVALHDETLERTTNVEELFPDRFREVPVPVSAAGAPAAPAPQGTRPTTRRWYLRDFTFEEIQQLDAGAWFDPKFAGTRIPSHVQIIEAMRGRCGLFIELKSPEKYEAQGFDVEGTVLAELKKFGLDQPGADPKAPVLIQSFTASSIQKLSQKLGTKLPLHFLFARRDRARWATQAALHEIRRFATGISPEKEVLTELPTVAEWARDIGLAVTPYTFRAGAVKGYGNVAQEMTFYLKAFALDGVITDNPDQAPK